MNFVYLQGRSKSLTSIDTLEPSSGSSDMAGTSSGGGGGVGPANVNAASHHHPDSRPCLDLDCTGGRLSVPPAWSADHSPTSPGFHRRRKLSTASKASTLRPS